MEVVHEEPSVVVEPVDHPGDGQGLQAGQALPSPWLAARCLHSNVEGRTGGPTAYWRQEGIHWPDF